MLAPAFGAPKAVSAVSLATKLTRTTKIAKCADRNAKRAIAGLQHASGGARGPQGPPGFASTFVTTTTFVTNGGSFNSGIADGPDSPPHAIAGGYDVSDSIGNLFNVMQNRPLADGSGWLVRMRSGAANPFTTEVWAVCVK